jgi:Fur family transcriptional regulator, ferric uptake regulator
MSNDIDQLSETLKSHGQSLTSARQTVFLALQNNEAQTMAQLVNRCEYIDRASVYRAVNLFEKLGIATRLQIGWKYKLELSESFHHHHHHLTCSRCGKVIPFEEASSLVKQLRSIARQNNFKMSDHQLEIQGLCNSCSN